MLLHPDEFIKRYEDTSYEGLLAVRDRLLADIRDFETRKTDTEELMIPSSGSVYQCNLQYLGRLCELIAEKYREK